MTDRTIDLDQRRGMAAQKATERRRLLAEVEGVRQAVRPGVARAEGTVKGAVASESDLAITNYDSLSADEVQEKLAELSQIDLAKVRASKSRPSSP